MLYLNLNIELVLNNSESITSNYYQKSIDVTCQNKTFVKEVKAIIKNKLVFLCNWSFLLSKKSKINTICLYQILFWGNKSNNKIIIKSN